MTQPHVTITEPNGVKRKMPLTSRGLSIGRAPDNNLVIDYPTTSRYHAEIRFEGNSYYIVDLGSGNGTYLDNRPLTPHQPVLWQPGMPVRIEEVVLQLAFGREPSRPQQPHRAVPSSPEGSETVVGWVHPDAEATQNRGTRLLVILLALVGVGCVCSVLGAVMYFNLVGN